MLAAFLGDCFAKILGLQSLWGSWPSPVGQFLGDFLSRYVTFQGNGYQVPRTFLCDYFGEPVGKSCKLSGDLGKFLWEFFGNLRSPWEILPKSSGNFLQVPGEVRVGICEFLRRSGTSPRGIPARPPWEILRGRHANRLRVRGILSGSS